MDEDRCEICGQATQVVEALILLPDGRWVRAHVHIACENSRMSQMRRAGAAGRN